MARKQIIELDYDSETVENARILGIDSPSCPLHRLAHLLNKTLYWDLIRQEEDYKMGHGVLMYHSEVDKFTVFLLDNKAEQSLVKNPSYDFFLFFYGETESYEVSQIIEAIGSMDFIFSYEEIFFNLETSDNKDKTYKELKSFLESYIETYETY